VCIDKEDSKIDLARTGENAIASEGED